MSDTIDITQKELVIQRIKKIEEDAGGVLRPSDVVEDAKDPSSPLHHLFEWDIEIAATRYWIERARQIIRTVRYEVEFEQHTVSSVAYVRDPDSESDEQGYRHVESVMTKKGQAARVMHAELSRVAAILRRTSDLSKVLSVQDDLTSIQRRVARLLADVEKMND